MMEKAYSQWKRLYVIHITKDHKLLVGIEKFQLLNASIIRGDEAIANIAAIADIRDENAIRQAVGTLLRRGDAVPYSRHHHGPAIDAGGDQFAGIESELAIMQILLVFRREFALEGDGQSHRFGHLRARIRKRRGGENDAHSKARANFKGRTSFADHGCEQFFPGSFLQGGEDRKTGIPETAGEFERPDAALVDNRIEIDVAAVTLVAQYILHPSERALEE